MVQPSYPHTVELPHSRPYSQKEFTPDGKPAQGEEKEVSTMAPSEFADPSSHANDSAHGQAEREDTKPVNPESSIRKELRPGPGEPH